MRKITIIILLVLISCFYVSALDLSKEGLDSDTYRKAFIKIHLRRAYIYKVFGDFPKAYEMYANLVEFDKSRKDYYIFLINELKRYQARYELFKGFDNIIVEEDSGRYNTLMEMADKQKVIVKKIRLYKAALREKENDPKAVIGIAKCYIKLNRHFTAKKWLKKLKDSKEANSLIQKIDYILNKSDVYMMKVQVNEKNIVRNEEKKMKVLNGMISKKDFDSAIKYINDLILDEPGNYKLFYKLADIYSRKAQYDNAIDQLDRAIILNSEFYEAYYMKGEILTKLGKISQAVEVYRKLIQKAPIDSKFNRLAHNMLNSLSSQ